jgi:hypothetical protein
MSEQPKPCAWRQKADKRLASSPPANNGEHWHWEPLYDQAALDAAVAAERQWRNTVDDMLTVCHAIASDDPRESITRLINWHVSVALDPSVSSDAAALMAAERERCAAVCEASALLGYGDDGATDWMVWRDACVHSAAAIRNAKDKT